MYALTEIGEKELLSELLKGLESYSPEASDFGISLFHIGTLKQEDALQYIKQRLVKLEDLYSKAQKRFDEFGSKIPFNLQMMLKVNIYRLEAEIKMTKSLVIEVENTQDWDTSIVKFMKTDKSKC